MRRTISVVAAFLVSGAHFASFGQCSPPDPTDAVLCVSKITDAQAAQFNATGVSAFWATLGAGTDSIFMQPSTNCVAGYCNFVGGATDASMTVKAACTNHGLYIYCAVQDNAFVDWNGTDYGDDSVDMYLDPEDGATMFTSTDKVGPYGADFTECTYQIDVFMGSTTPPTSCRFAYYDSSAWTWLQNNTMTFAQAQTLFGFRVKESTVDSTHKTQEWYFPWQHIGDVQCAITQGQDLSNKRMAFCIGYNDQDPDGTAGSPDKLRWPLRGDPWGMDQNYYGNLSVPSGVVVDTIDTAIQLAPPSLLSPSSGATGLPLSTALRWSKQARASSYGLEVSIASNFYSTIVNQTGLTDTTYSLSGLTAGTIYYWRVDAYSSGTYITSPWTGTWSFTTVPPNPTIPPTPVLATPAHNAANVSTSPYLSWYVSTGASFYSLQVASTPGFASPIVDMSGRTTTSYTANGLANATKYYWRVNAVNLAGSSAWALDSFTTIVPLPDQVVQIAPANGQIVPTDSAKLVWHKGTPSVTRYCLLTAADSLMSYTKTDSTITDTSSVLKSLANGQTYWWRVRAGNAAGWGPYSDALKFTVSILTSVKPLAGFHMCSFGMNSARTALQYAIPIQCHVELKLFDVSGRMAASVVNQVQGPGYYSVTLPSGSWAKGSYLAVLKAGDFVQKGLITLVQ